MRFAGVGVIADDSPVAARLQAVSGPFVHFIAHGGFRKVDATVVSDVQVISQAQAAVVVDGRIAAIGLVGHLFDLALGRDPVQAHAANADIKVVMPIKRHAQRRATNVGVDFHAFVIGRKKPDDVAVTRTGIEVVVPVQNHILRAFNSAQPNHLDIAQFVVLRPSRAAVWRGRGRLGQRVVGRADVNLADDAVPVFQPADVNDRREHQYGCQHHAVVAAVQRQSSHAVDDQQHYQRAHQGFRHRTFSASQADAAQHSGRQHGHLQPHTNVTPGSGQPRGEKDAPHCGEHTAGHIGQRYGAPYGNAGVVGGAARAANRCNVPARAQARQENMAKDGHHRITPDDDGQAQPVTAANGLPRGRIGQTPGNCGGIVGNQQVVTGPVNDQRDQRGQKCAQPEVANQHTVDGPQHRAKHQRGCHGACHRPLHHVHQKQRAEVGQGKHGADRQINAADDHHQRHAKHDKSDFASLAAGVRHVGGRKKIWQELRKPQGHQQQHGHGNCCLHPAFGQQLTQQMVRPIAVAPARQAIQQRLSRRNGIDGGGALRA